MQAELENWAIDWINEHCDLALSNPNPVHYLRDRFAELLEGKMLCEKEPVAIWVLTTEYNLYDQEGAYFVQAFAGKPNEQQLIDAGVSKWLVPHVLGGGGRIEWEQQWYILEKQETTPLYAPASPLGNADISPQGEIG